jgi:hypothetical protein
MENPPKNRDDELEDNNASNQSPDQAEEDVSVGENRAEEKVENRSTKKQEMNEALKKSISGTEAHHDPRNEHPDSGPAPLKRY